MKLVLLVVFAVVVVSQTEAAPLDALHNLDNILNVTVDFLKAFKISFGVDADKKLAAYQEHKNNKIASTVDGILKEVQEKAEESGKDVEHCKENVKSLLNSTQKKVLFELDRCFEENNPDWSVHDEAFDSLIARGEKLHQKNEQIEQDCQSERPWATQLCIAKKLPEVGLSFGLYKHAIGEFKGILARSFQAAIDTIGRCIEQPLANFTNEVENARKGALECIEIAQY